MGIRQRLGREFETIQDMERAIDKRYLEASRLIVSPGGVNQWGGVYLLGYVGEMVLKMAYFKLQDCHLETPAKIELSGASLVAVRFGIVKSKSDFDRHSLTHLLDLVLLTRQSKGRSRFPSIGENELSKTVTRLQTNWWVAMRYFGEAPLVSEVKEAFEDASWLRTYYYELWS